MSLATLMVYPRPDSGDAWRNVFSFDHAFAHRELMMFMGPLNQWSTMPYFVDPADYNPLPAGRWPLYHQQAHNDFNGFLPAYGAQLEPAFEAMGGIPQNQILIDTDFSRHESQTWWTFANHQEHLIAADSVTPYPQTGAITGLPWWMQEPRLVNSGFW
jgi:hypothetical protein